ncbi:MAG: S41 family peptidase [bacterium]|nr:S41 family peptidase [bacterium]
MWTGKKLMSLAGAALLVSVIFVFGVYIGIQMPGENKVVQMLGKRPPVSVLENTDFAPFWQAWDLIEQKYVNIGDINRQDMVYGAISGMLKSLGDPYTVFFPPKENAEFQSEVKGAFEGVGMEVGMRKNIITIIAPLKDSPAEKAGVKAGDKILKIDDHSASDLSLEEAVRYIRGPKGTKVKLLVAREGEESTLTIEIERAVINIPVIDTSSEKSAADGKPSPEDKYKDMAGQNGIYIITLYNFSETSPSQFRTALRSFILSGKNKLILDLRNNPGGYLEASVDIASWFLPQGDIVVQEDFGKGNKEIHRSKGYDIFKDLPIVVLVNEGSASASEILAGALRDHGIAKLIGAKTFGKGSVQELIPITADTSLKITIAKWLTPNGVSISEKGLDPDISVEFKKEDADKGIDPQMAKAIEVLKAR